MPKYDQIEPYISIQNLSKYIINKVKKQTNLFLVFLYNIMNEKWKKQVSFHLSLPNWFELNIILENKKKQNHMINIMVKEEEYT